MNNSAEIKKQNKSLIRKLLMEGQSYSKQQISLQTGLSVASCNTYLNEMEQSGEVVGEKQKLHEVGRNSVVYKLNEDYESFICIYFELIQGIKSITTIVLSPTGNIRYHQVNQFAILDTDAIKSTLTEVLKNFSNASQIIAGTPSIAENGVIRHCDIPELEGVELAAILEKQYHLPVSLANDMYYKAYGYYKQEQLSDQIITLVNYPTGVLPGTATVYKGTVLTGRNLFAGMVGFLDYGISLEEQIQRLHGTQAKPLIIQAVIALISILNPHKLLFTGDLIKESYLEQIRIACQNCIPEEYMPDFAFVSNTNPYYLVGMYWTAIDKKEENL